MAESKQAAIAVDGWDTRSLPPQLTRRFDFDSYAQTRAFLDDLAELSEAIGHHPNLTFAREYVTVSIDPIEDQLQQREADFASQINDLAAKAR